MRYDKPLINAQRHCDAHPHTEYTLRHALTCGTGGNRIHRHNTVQNALQSIAHSALGSTAFHVERQPWIIRHGTRDRSGRVMTGLQGDLGLRGIHQRREKTIIDVRIFYPDYPASATTTTTGGRRGERAAAASVQTPTELLLLKHEHEKYRQYQAACDERNLHFVPFVMTTDGAVGPAAKSLLNSLKWRNAKKCSVKVE